MSSINFHTKEISAKIVYYGPGLCGKTTSLQRIYSAIPEERRPQIVSLATEVDRTIFFDFLPITAYRIRDFSVRLQLYTVPGQVFYNATRKLVLNGVDGIVFVADSQRAMKDSNLESLQNLAENLGELGLEMDQVPFVLQYNKRDLEDVYPVEEMQRLYNHRQVPAFPTVAIAGEGLFDALKAISQLVVNDLVRKGLGKQLRAQAAAKVVGHGAALGVDESLGAGSSMAEAVSQAAASHAPSQRQADTHAGRGFPSLFPSEAHTHFSASMVTALSQERWGAVVNNCHGLLTQLAQTWNKGTGVANENPLPAYLLEQGACGSRYRRLMQAMKAQEQGRSHTRADAMNALVLLLNVLW